MATSSCVRTRTRRSSPSGVEVRAARRQGPYPRQGRFDRRAGHPHLARLLRGMRTPAVRHRLDERERRTCRELLLPHPPRSKRRLRGTRGRLDTDARSLRGGCASRGACQSELEARQGARDWRAHRAGRRAREGERGELDTFLAAQLASVLGPERYRAEVERRQQELGAAQRELGDALTANLVLGQAGSRTPAQLVVDWPTMTMEEKRAVVRAYIERIILAKADPKRRRWQPMDERVQIDWVAAPASRSA